MKEVVEKEVIRFLEACIIYPISDSAWVSPVHVVPKKGGITLVPNDKNELIPTRTVSGWRMCIDYRMLNKATRKDHFVRVLVLKKIIFSEFFKKKTELYLRDRRRTSAELAPIQFNLSSSSVS